MQIFPTGVATARMAGLARCSTASRSPRYNRRTSLARDRGDAGRQTHRIVRDGNLVPFRNSVQREDDGRSGLFLCQPQHGVRTAGDDHGILLILCQQRQSLLLRGGSEKQHVHPFPAPFLSLRRINYSYRRNFFVNYTAVQANYQSKKHPPLQRFFVLIVPNHRMSGGKPVAEPADGSR